MSAQACLAGLYPPTDEQKWHDEIMWQPISVHTVPAKSDHVLLAGNDCPKFDFYHTKYMKESLEFQLVYTDSVRKFREWSMNSGLCITSMFDSCLLYDTLVIEKSFNKTLPEWAEREISPDGLMERFVKLHVKSYTDLPLLARLKSGFILKEMMDRFDQKINSKITEKVWLYSGHDTTIINILNPLGLFKVNFKKKLSSKCVFFQFKICFLLSRSHIFHHMVPVCILNYTKHPKINIISNFSIESQMKSLKF